MAGKLSSSKLQLTAKVAVFANLILLIALFTATMVQRNKSSQAHADRDDHSEHTGDAERADASVGMYCYKLEEKQCREKGYTVKRNHGSNTTSCCTVLSSHLYNLMSEVFPQKLRSDSSKEKALERVRGMMRELRNDSSTVDIRPAAHLGVLVNSSLAGPDTEVPRIHWEEASDTSYITEGIEHGGDRVIIKRAGYYFIYTGLQFSVDPSTVSSGAIVSYVFRDNNNSRLNRRKLMTARESSCRTGRAGQEGPVSVYMAGIFLLHEKDEISVRTASHSLLHRSPATTYMGVHLL